MPQPIRILAAVAFTSGLVGCGPNKPADLVLRNGNIYTGVGDAPTAQAIAILGDTIVFVGSNADARAYGGPKAQVIDLGGATVFPGWADAHADLRAIGEREIAHNLEAGNGSKLSPPSDADVDSAIVVGARRMVEMGWTQVHDVGGTWEQIDRIRRLYRTGALKLRIYEAVRGPGRDADSLLSRGPGEREFDGRFTVRAIHMALDGALERREAALLAPYADQVATTGSITADTAAVRTTMLRALERDLQIQVAAVGDRANRLAFDLVRAAHRMYKWEEHERSFRKRWRVEHADIIDQSDVFRFRALELMPSVQPSHAIEGLHIAPSRLGADRLEGAYAWRTFVELQVPVAGGSDAPTGRGDPRVEFYAAVSRRDLHGYSGPDSLWHPEEALLREQALNLFTRFAAWAAFENDVRGEIRPGGWADLTVFDTDLMTIPEPSILGAKVVITVIGGEIVYSARP